VGSKEAARSLAPYLHQRASGQAFCLAKVAMTLDGRIAAADRSPTWITGEDARHDAHELRAECQAIVVGSGTALTDRPALTVRGVDDAPITPLRVVLDGRGRVPADGPLFDMALGSTLVLTSEACAATAVGAWLAAGAKVEVVPAGFGGGLDLHAVLALLGQHGVLQAMFEGGARVHGSLHAQGLIDHLVTYVAPFVLGTDAIPAFDWSGPATVDGASRLELVGARQVGTDLRVDYVRAAVAA
jgi:diaminohydroxyphosphoribosylaminopyrimidine deaminase / 5-amino-6-(5-phosphoribosylamino)uracil reductase